MTVDPGTPEVITGISSMAMRHVLAELDAAYEQRSGQPVAIVSVGGVDAARRVADGEAFDFVVLATEAIDRLAAGGHVDPASRTGLATAARSSSTRPTSLLLNPHAAKCSGRVKTASYSSISGTESSNSNC